MQVPVYASVCVCVCVCVHVFRRQQHAEPTGRAIGMGLERDMEKHSPASRATQQIRPGTKSESALSEQHSAP